MVEVIGAFYELPNGQIAKTIGWNGKKKTILYYFDDGQGSHTINEDETKEWKYLKLYDFPNARDPKLPYVFDLLWDIKYTSDLVRELNGHYDEESIREEMKNYKIQLG